MPTGSPLATLRIMPNTLPSSVVMRTTCGIFTPLSMHLISEMPLPAARGHKNDTGREAKKARPPDTPAKATSASPLASVPFFSCATRASTILNFNAVSSSAPSEMSTATTAVPTAVGHGVSALLATR